MWVSVCLCVCVLAAVQAAHADHKPEEPSVRSPAGVFHGSWMESRRGRRFQAYRGIRYAQPPVGELRFQPPILISNYSGEVDAREEGPACPQPTYNDYPVDEDCLRLNVYTPNSDSGAKLPVLVFIHAGGFYSVSGRSDVAGPSYLMDKDVVLVTINYRLASLGFLSTGDKYAPGNNGFKDQVTSLRWVRQNIAAFGGDARRVTLAGYSAGAFSVALHLASPLTRGLFHRAISMSGSPVSQIPTPRHQRHLAERQARLLNCPTDTSKAIIDCLKTKTSKEIGDSLDQMFEFGYDPVLLWVPIVEPDFGQERFLTKPLLESICSGELQQVPYIISQTKDEFFWKAFNVLNNETLYKEMHNEWERVAPVAFYLSGNNTHEQSHTLRHSYLGGENISNATAAQLGELYSDAIIGFGVERLANLMSSHSSQPVYHYQFHYRGNHSHYMDPVTNKPVGVAHHDDLIYLFNISYSFPPIPPSNSLDSQMVDKMTDIVYNFMRFGDPNPRDSPAPRWPRMRRAHRTYLRIDTHNSVHTDLFADRLRVWEQLYPLDYNTCR